jgi:hypothetical protein
MVSICAALVAVRVGADHAPWHATTREDVRVTIGALVVVILLGVWIARSGLPEAKRFRSLAGRARRGRPA